MGTASTGRSRRFATRAMMPSERSATTIPASTSSQKWFAVARTQNQTQAGQSAQRAFDHQCRDGAEEEDADDQRVGGVEARHRRVRVGERAEAGLVVDAVDEAVGAGTSTAARSA